MAVPDPLATIIHSAGDFSTQSLDIETLLLNHLKAEDQVTDVFETCKSTLTYQVSNWLPGVLNPVSSISGSQVSTVIDNLVITSSNTIDLVVSVEVVITGMTGLSQLDVNLRLDIRMCRASTHCNHVDCISIVEEHMDPWTINGPMPQAEQWGWQL